MSKNRQQNYCKPKKGKSSKEDQKNVRSVSCSDPNRFLKSRISDNALEGTDDEEGSLETHGVWLFPKSENEDLHNTAAMNNNNSDSIVQQHPINDYETLHLNRSSLPIGNAETEQFCCCCHCHCCCCCCCCHRRQTRWSPRENDPTYSQEHSYRNASPPDRIKAAHDNIALFAMSVPKPKPNSGSSNPPVDYLLTANDLNQNAVFGQLKDADLATKNVNRDVNAFDNAVKEANRDKKKAKREKIQTDPHI